jgi:nicotinamidase-related amidase
MSDWEMDGKPALVILHMQEGMVGKGTFHPERHQSVVKAVRESGMLNCIQALLEAFRDKKLPVVFVNVLHNPFGASSAYGWLFQYAGEPEGSAGFSGILDSSSMREELEVIPELNRRTEEPLLFNWLLGAFNNSGLDLILKFKGVKTVVLAGFTAHSVVYHTAVQAMDLRYSVIIPRDASVSPAPAQKAYEAVMDIMAPSIALVTTTEDVLSHLSRV